MESISADRRTELLVATTASIWKLELLDAYGFDAARRALTPAEAEASLAPIVEETAALSSAGIELHRIKTISEPASAYMRGGYHLAALLVEVGEDIRYLPRRLTSGLLLPGNDMFVLDGSSVMFNLHDGDGNQVGVQWDDDPALVKQCRIVFEATWSVAIPHRDYTLA